MNIEIFKIIVEGIVMIILGIAAKVILPILKEKQRYGIIDKAVKAAEMKYIQSGSGAQKKEFVISFLIEKGLVTPNELGEIPIEVDILIEAAVKELDKLVVKDEG